jgi:hypothetical protein
MKQAMVIEPKESVVDDFSRNLFQLMRYDDPGFSVRCNVDLTFFMCEEQRHAQTDVCVVDDKQILLIIQEDKRCVNAGDPEAQLVAEAIAAFYENNLRRAEGEFPIMRSRIMAGITMCGTSPTFYKIPITQHLVNCVELGIEPITETKVLKHVPFFPDGFDNGMVPLGNRLVALKAYNTLNAFFIWESHCVD